MISYFLSSRLQCQGTTRRWRPSPDSCCGQSGGSSTLLWGGVLALRPACEEGTDKEEVAPTPSFQEPLAQPSAPSPGQPSSPQKPGLAALCQCPHFTIWLH